MPAPERYRAKAAEFAMHAEATPAPAERREFDQQHERSLTALADNERWLADNRDKTMHPAEPGAFAKPALAEEGKPALAAEEERILRCLGAAVIMRWNTLPTKLRKELFDDAGSIGDLSDATTLRGQIARFLHKHKDGETVTGTPR